MNTQLIGELVRLRYKLMWARTRTRNGKIALFFAGYLLLVMAVVVFAFGGIGAGIVAVRAGKGHAIAAGLLTGLYAQALLASVLLGFGVNTVFAETELRRYPLKAVERRVARHFIGIADPFWFLILALELGLLVGLYVVGNAPLFTGALAVLLLMVSNYLLARVVAMLVERMVQRKGGSAILLASIIALAMLPATIAPKLERNRHALDPIVRALSYTPPFGAATAMTRPGVEALYGLGVIACWLVGLAALLVVLERRPLPVRVAQATKISWQGPCERLGALFGPRNAPLVAQWLRFYFRNNRFRTIYPLATPLVVVLVYTQAKAAGSKGQFAAVLGAFAIGGFMGTTQFAVNQFGYMGGGFRRYFLLPTDPSALLRTGSYTFVMLGAALIPACALGVSLFSPIPLDARALAMLVGGAVTALFLMQGVSLWVSLLAPRKGNYNASFGNDLSLAGNIVVIGGALTMLFMPRLIAAQWPGALVPGNWWAVIPLIALAVVFYVVSLRRASIMFRTRRERILAVVEGRS